jgi:hypothetical protein
MPDHERIQAIIDERKPMMYNIPPAQVSDADCLGVLVAHWARWDGAAICEAFLSALEDANFHTLRANLEPIIRADLDQ